MNTFRLCTAHLWTVFRDEQFRVWKCPEMNDKYSYINIFRGEDIQISEQVQRWIHERTQELWGLNSSDSGQFLNIAYIIESLMKRKMIKYFNDRKFDFEGNLTRNDYFSFETIGDFCSESEHLIIIIYLWTGHKNWCLLRSNCEISEKISLKGAFLRRWMNQVGGIHCY
jgi:hypothetical protein